MTSTEPKVSDSGWYDTGQTALALGVDRRTIARHTEKGYIKCKVRKCNNRRVYSGREIKRYWGAQY